MSRTLPIHTDPSGVRWTVVTPRMLGRLSPLHQTPCLTAEGETVPRGSPKDVLRFLRSVIRDDIAALAVVYLLGDAHHQDECYDITARVAECLSDDAPNRFDTAERLAGRHLIFLWKSETASPNWWTADLGGVLSAVSESAEIDGVLLSAEWGLSYDPDAPEIPHLSSFERFHADAAWLFQTGEPSVRVRGAYFREAASLAVENLAEAARRTGKRVGVALPLSKRRQWLVSPRTFAQAGITPFVTGSGEQVLSDEGVLRLSESAGCTEFLPTGRLGADASGFLTTLGFEVAPGGWTPPLLPATRSIRTQVALLHPREEHWAHGWDDPTDYFSEQARRMAKALRMRGISFLTTDERNLDVTLRERDPDLLVVAPARSLRASTISSLSEWVGARRPTVLMEPLPYLSDGKPSPELDSLSLRLSRSRLEFEGRPGERALDAFLKKAKVTASFGVFRRETGEALSSLWRTTFEASPHVYGAFLCREPKDVSALVELEGEQNAEIWDGQAWTPPASWSADGRTYFEMAVTPAIWHFFRRIPRWVLEDVKN